MSDQEATEPTEATPEPRTPDSAEELYQKRYNDIRPEYDRVQNELRKYTDPEQRRQVFNEWAEEFGYTLDEGEQQYQEYEDPSEAVKAELQALKSEWQNFTQQQQQERAMQIAESYSASKLDELGVTNEKQREWIVSRASAMPALQHQGAIVPDIEAAVQDYKQFVNELQSTWAESKKDVPHTPTGGQENTGVPAWSDDPDQRTQQRQQAMMERFRSFQS